MEESSAGIYSIGAVGRMLGLSPATLRTWEERYGAVVPRRSAGGQRLYSLEQVEQLRAIKREIDQGASPADAHRVLLERLRADSTSRRPPAPAPPDAVSVLLIERDPHAAELFEYFLESEGYDVTVALDPEDVATLPPHVTPALAVLDLTIAGGSGIELCGPIKRRYGAKVIAVSTLAADADVLANVDAFLQKPVDPFELLTLTKHLIAGSDAVRTS